ncbi:hypothetical protein HMSSN036_66760 [Paenibacillus macerans]|nr:hypothetical protein HMSSN036_66760 [Paenibacillus macerans]
MIYFYDHDMGDFLSEHALNLNINLKEWFILADLISQMEGLIDTQADIYFDEYLNLKAEYRQELLTEIEEIKKRTIEYLSIRTINLLKSQKIIQLSTGHTEFDLRGVVDYSNTESEVYLVLFCTWSSVALFLNYR